MNKLFNPQAVAIVGASVDKQKIGAAVMLNMINAGYQGKIIPINPKYPKIFGADCYADLKSVPFEVDLAVVAVPADGVLDVVKQAVEKQVAYVIVISAGFAEIGEEGRKRELSLLQAVAGSKTRILGPNCLGIISTKGKLNASFAAQTPLPGNIAFLSQSGAFNTAMLDMAAEAKLGFADFVSVGNMSDINEIDLVKYWQQDKDIAVIGMYLEEFSGARELMALAQNSPKPVVILHPGESASAQAAIASHTGSMAGSGVTANAAFEKANMIKVNDVTQMFDVLSMLSLLGADAFGENVALVTNAGGPGIVATDLLVSHGLKVNQLSQANQDKLKGLLPAAASTHNPVDLLGDARSDRYASVLEVLTQVDEVDTLVIVLTPQYMTEIEKTAEVISEAARRSNKYILPLFLGGEKIDAGAKIFNKYGITSFKSLEPGIAALGKIVAWKRSKNVEKYDLAFDKFVGLERNIDLSAFVKNRPVTLPYSVIEALMKQVGVKMPLERLVSNREEALAFAGEHGYPMVVKATADQVVHKTDDQAIFLNLMNEGDLDTAYRRLQETVARLTGQSDPQLLVQKQLRPTEYLELFLGANRSGSSRVYDEREAGFGHLMVFGYGGIYTEVFKDICATILPMSHAEIEQLINTTAVSEIIKGARRRLPLALHLLVELIGKIQLLLMTYPEIISLDINPIFLNENDCLAMDVKIFVG